MKGSVHVVAGLTAALLLVACGGGGGGSPTPVVAATSNTTLPISPANGATAVKAIAAAPLTFSSGVPALGTTGATTVTINTPATGSPTFSIAANGGQASGTLGFGSCIFTVTTSTFVAPHPLAPGSVRTISPCTITVATAGLPATGAAGSAEVKLVLGDTTSTPVSLAVTVSPSGTVTVNGNTLPTTVPTGPVTGAI